MDWQALGATLGRAALAYALLIVFIRLSGARTLAKMNAFDLVVTIALGSLLANTIVSSSVPLPQGILAMAALILLQWFVARASVASGRFRKLVANEGVAVYHDDAFDEDAMRRARVTRPQVESAIRNAGHPDAADVGAVWLETNGTLSVVGKRRTGSTRA